MDFLGSRHLRNRKIVNLSGEVVEVGRKTIPTSKAVTSAAKLESGKTGVPARVAGKLIVVSKEIAEKNPDRDDLIFIGEKDGRKRFCTAWKNFKIRRRLPTDRELKYSFWADLLKRAGRNRYLVDSIGLSRLERLRGLSRNELKTIKGIAFIFAVGKSLPSEFRSIARDIDPMAAFATRLRQMRREALSRQETYGIVDHNTDATVTVRERVSESGERYTEAEGQNKITGEAFRASGGTFSAAKEQMASRVQYSDDQRTKAENALSSSSANRPTTRGEREGRSMSADRAAAERLAKQRAMVMER
jgi:hypothetical protein